MIDLLLLKGVFAGVAVAAPIGPNAIYNIRQTISNSGRAGLCCGGGVALGHFTFAALGIFFLSSVSAFLNEWLIVFRLAGASFLLYLGVRSLSRILVSQEAPDRHSLLKCFSDSFILCITNPICFIMFGSILINLNLPVDETSKLVSVSYLAGVLTGSFLWWTGLTLLVKSVKHLIKNRFLTITNMVFSFILILFGVYNLGTIGFKYLNAVLSL